MATRKRQEIAVLVIDVLALLFLVSLPVAAGSFTTWIPMTSNTTNDLNGIWGADSSHVFAVGKAGTVLRYDGSDWRSMTSNTTNDLNGVWGADSSHVFAVGISGNVIYYNGSYWSLVTSGITGNLYGIWGVDRNDIFVVGESGTLAHYDGSKFSSMNRDSVRDLRSVRGFSSTDVFAAGWAGTILRYLPPITNSISQIQGEQGENLDVTITGKNLTGVSEVWLGPGISVNSFTVVNSRQLTVNITIVAGAAVGARDVSVITPGGSFVLPNSFTVKQGLPVITSISPENGSQGATLTVIVSGRNLDGATSVSFGAGVSVQSFTNLSPTQLRANVLVDEEAVTGLRDVSVTTPGGSSTLGNRFNIKEKPLSVLFIAVIWVGIAIVIGLFIFILNILRKKRSPYKL